MPFLDDDRDETVDHGANLMLYENGFIDKNTFVSPDFLTDAQKFEYVRVSRELEGATVEFLKYCITAYLRQLVNRIRLKRKLPKPVMSGVGMSLEGTILDPSQPLDVNPPIEVEVAVRPTLAILKDLTDRERLTQYLLTLRLVDFRIPTFRPGD